MAIRRENAAPQVALPPRAEPPPPRVEPAHRSPHVARDLPVVAWTRALWMGLAGAGACLVTGALVATLTLPRVRWAPIEAPVAEEADVGVELPADAPVEPVSVESAGATVRLGDFSMDIASAARRLVGAKRPPGGFRDDCSGFVSAILTASGIPMDGNTAQLYDVASREGLLHHDPIPTIGDLAFFDNTHDRNENRQWDDARTHIAVVVDVEPDGTILLAHHGSERALVRMNLLPEHIQQHEGEDGRLYNSYLRRKSLSDGKWEMNLTGELWAAFAHVAPDVDWEVRR